MLRSEEGDITEGYLGKACRKYECFDRTGCLHLQGRRCSRTRYNDINKQEMDRGGGQQKLLVRLDRRDDMASEPMRRERGDKNNARQNVARRREL
jgi:hypothetical protein